MKSKKTAQIWHNTKMPADLFFEILDSENLKLLVKDIPENKGLKKPKKKELQKAWDNIFDEFYEYSDNPKLRLILKVKKTILIKTRRLTIIKLAIENLAYASLPEENFVKIVEGLRKMRIKIDLKKPRREEILRVLKVDLAQLETDIEIEKDNLSNLTKGEKRTFEENCVSLEDAGYQVAETVTLRKYMAYIKAAIVKSNKQKKNARREVNRSNK